MMPATATEIEESNSSFIESWRRVYPKLPGGEYRVLPGVTAIWGDVALSFSNAVLLSCPVIDRRDLEARVETLRTFLKTKSKPPMFLVCRDWVPPAVQQFADQIIARAGLRPAIPIIGMVAEELRPPARRLPDLRFRKVADPDSCNSLADINSFAYGFSVDYGREAFANPDIWAQDFNGYLAYSEGAPVATAAVTPLAGHLYVGFVATRPEVQRQGYAEAVTRHALSEQMNATGIRRSVLHATQEGYPLYVRMGYRETARFTGYIP